jgi:hypothetical protein
MSGPCCLLAVRTLALGLITEVVLGPVLGLTLLSLQPALGFTHDPPVHKGR